MAGAEAPWCGARNGGTESSAVAVCRSSRDGVDSRDFERLGVAERRQDAGEPAGQHRLARPRRPHEEEVVRADRSDLERAARALLPAQVREIRSGRCRVVLCERLEGRSGDLAAEVRDDLAEMSYRHRLDARECRLGRRLRRADDMRQPGSSGSFRNGEGSGDRPDPSVERELTDRRVLGESLGR